jgi:hypothetical protein
LEINVRCLQKRKRKEKKKKWEEEDKKKRTNAHRSNIRPLSASISHPTAAHRYLFGLFTLFSSIFPFSPSTCLFLSSQAFQHSFQKRHTSGAFTECGSSVVFINHNTAGDAGIVLGLGDGRRERQREVARLAWCAAAWRCRIRSLVSEAFMCQMMRREWTVDLRMSEAVGERRALSKYFRD